MKRLLSLLMVLAMLGLPACQATDGHDHGKTEQCCGTDGKCCK